MALTSPLIIYGLNTYVGLTSGLDSILAEVLVAEFGSVGVAGEWVLFSICLGELRRAPVSMLNAPFCPLT